MFTMPWAVLNVVKTFTELEMTTIDVSTLRARCEELHETETMEPEDVYEQVAEEFDISIDELFLLLEAE